MIRVSVQSLALVLAIGLAMPAKAEPIAIPFDPDIGSRYEVKTEKKEFQEQGGKTVRSVDTSSVYHLTFAERLPDGYRTSWKIVDAQASSTGSGLPGEALASVAQGSIGLTNVVITGPEGYPRRLENLDEIRPKLKQLMTEAIELHAAPKLPNTDKVLSSVLGMFDNLTPETAARTLLQEAAILATAQGSELEIGEELAYADEVPSLFGIGTMKATGRYLLETVDRQDGTARIRWTRNLDSDDAARVTQEFIRSMLEKNVPQDKLEAAIAGMAGMKVDRHDEASFEVSLKDGVVRRVDYQVSTLVSQGEQSQTGREIWTLVVRPLS